MFEPPGSNDPLLGAEIGKRRREWNWNGVDADFSSLAEAGWWAWPILAVLGLGALAVVAWSHYFGRRR